MGIISDQRSAISDQKQFDIKFNDSTHLRSHYLLLKNSTPNLVINQDSLFLCNPILNQDTQTPFGGLSILLSSRSANHNQKSTHRTNKLSTIFSGASIDARVAQRLLSNHQATKTNINTTTTDRPNTSWLSLRVPANQQISKLDQTCTQPVTDSAFE